MLATQTQEPNNANTAVKSQAWYYTSAMTRGTCWLSGQKRSLDKSEGLSSNLPSIYFKIRAWLTGLPVTPVLWREWRQCCNSLLAASLPQSSVRNPASRNKAKRDRAGNLRIKSRSSMHSSRLHRVMDTLLPPTHTLSSLMGRGPVHLVEGNHFTKNVLFQFLITWH